MTAASTLYQECFVRQNIMSGNHFLEQQVFSTSVTINPLVELKFNRYGSNLTRKSLSI